MPCRMEHAVMPEIGRGNSLLHGDTPQRKLIFEFPAMQWAARLGCVGKHGGD